MNKQGIQSFTSNGKPSAQITNNDFVEEAMGCAQETLEGILSYLHREHVHPHKAYLEQYLKSNRDE